MKKAVRVNLICPVEISEASTPQETQQNIENCIRKDIFYTEVLSQWVQLEIDDLGEWEEYKKKKEREDLIDKLNNLRKDYTAEEILKGLESIGAGVK